MRYWEAPYHRVNRRGEFSEFRVWIEDCGPDGWVVLSESMGDPESCVEESDLTHASAVLLADRVASEEQRQWENAR